MFWKRTATAILLIAYVIGMLVLGYFFGHIFVDLLILSFGLLALYEMSHSFHLAGYKVFKSPLFVIGILLYPGYYLLEYFKGIGMQAMFLIFIFSCAIAITLFTFSHERELKDLMATIFIMVYPFMFLSAAFVLSSNYCAVFSMLFAVFLPVSCDSFAYWIGSTVKGKKLCPLISPNKTISGAIGGLFGGIVVAIAFFFLFEFFNVLPAVGYVPFTDTLWKSALIYVAIGIIGSIVSQVGDIAASRIKRQLGIKDYGKIFPGHGGSMDRIDSIMFTLILLLLAFTIIY
ncbi:MAG: phosphatidate cytidylyltransferase [Clostridia bacterium]|nr:phosphatidate cytidylyltransferase [Clostridia bacterium]